jgi:hypothetical protein
MGFLDGFLGGGSVSFYAKAEGFAHVTACDIAERGIVEAEAEESEKVLPRVMSFVVNPDQEDLIERAVETASDGTPGRDRRARGLANLARRFLESLDEAQ